MKTKLILEEYKENYNNIFNTFYPAKNSTGFTERNLSVNFAKAYEKINPNAITWYEFQFGEKNNLHYDAIIINSESKELIIIESKRFSNLLKKINEVEEDIIRINKSVSTYYADFKSRIENFEEYTIIGVILADVWTETKNKTALKDAFLNSCFLQTYFTDLYATSERWFLNGEYFCLDFHSLKTSDSISKNYYLLGMAWELSKK